MDTMACTRNGPHSGGGRRRRCTSSVMQAGQPRHNGCRLHTCVEAAVWHHLTPLILQQGRARGGWPGWAGHSGFRCRALRGRNPKPQQAPRSMQCRQFATPHDMRPPGKHPTWVHARPTRAFPHAAGPNPSPVLPSLEPVGGARQRYRETHPEEGDLVPHHGVEVLLLRPLHHLQRSRQSGARGCNLPAKRRQRPGPAACKWGALHTDWAGPMQAAHLALV